MEISPSHPGRWIFTIGHSNHELSRLLDLLREHGVDVLVDVRSQPYSRYATQFNRETMMLALTDAGLRYLFLGAELGGRPEGPDFYDAEGHVLYGRVADSRFFREGVERLEKGIEQFRVALMCSEEDPTHCHRRLLVGRVLTDRGIEVRHIRGDGRVEIESGFAARTDHQMTLFGASEEESWRSTRSVSRRGTPASSSRS